MAEKESVGDDEVQLSKKLLEIEDWQADVVLTTFVQFFHSVISNRNRMLKKFHRIAGSIIILDEVQNIKAEYWPLIGTVLYHLSEFLNCRMILMTATQPLIFETANRVFEHNQQKQIEFRPLLNSEETGFYFEQFERTKLVSLIDKENPLENADDFYALFCEKWDPSKSCLIVVNTIKRSLDIFERLSEEETISDIYYLSTNIVPVHRKYVIRKIKRLLDEDRKVILVSTQSVEAGVDLDFDMGFRDVGPLDRPPGSGRPGFSWRRFWKDALPGGGWRGCRGDFGGTCASDRRRCSSRGRRWRFSGAPAPSVPDIRCPPRETRPC